MARFKNKETPCPSKAKQRKKFIKKQNRLEEQGNHLEDVDGEAKKKSDQTKRSDEVLKIILKTFAIKGWLDVSRLCFVMLTLSRCLRF